MAKVDKKVSAENWDDLEIFTSKGARIKNPQITILESNSFMFNAAFVHKADISQATHVILGYSEQNNSITFQFTTDSKALGALKLLNRGNGASVGSNSFFNFYFLKNAELVGKYIPRQIKVPRVGDLWVIDLNKKNQGNDGK